MTGDLVFAKDEVAHDHCAPESALKSRPGGQAHRRGDEHSIKFTEACFREYALNPKPVYILAAADGVSRLG
jgi:hypothetical protein